MSLEAYIVIFLIIAVNVAIVLMLHFRNERSIEQMKEEMKDFRNKFKGKK
jgi:magnesium-transporting ATPase (P-type)